MTFIPNPAVVPPSFLPFTDNVTTDVTIGSIAADQMVLVDVSILSALGNQTSYRLQVTVTSTSGLEFDLVQIEPVLAIETVVVSALVVGPSIVMRLAGSGPGTAMTAVYRIDRTLPT